MPEIWLAQNAWISVGFYSLSSEKLQQSNSIAQSNSSEVETCISEIKWFFQNYIYFGHW